jgi:hypothetical protein
MPTNASEASIEAEIKTKGLTAPRLTPADIDQEIADEGYYVFPGTTVTVCALTLCNGFVVIGHSASASKENFDEAIGCRIARERARNEIWALEGYLLRERLAALEEIGVMADATNNIDGMQAMNAALREATKL